MSESILSSGMPSMFQNLVLNPSQMTFCLTNGAYETQNQYSLQSYSVLTVKWEQMAKIARFTILK